MNIIKPSSPMKTGPSDKSELETECLYGEVIEVLDDHCEWFYCKLLTDNYLGWVKKIDVGYLDTLTHRVISKRSFLFKNKDIKKGSICYVPLGGHLSISKFEGNWAQVNLQKDNNHDIAYIHKNHITKIGSIINDWVGVAEKLLGTPYVWGGRDTIGLDCSALLQLSYQTYGKSIPRNTTDQLLLNNKKINDLNKLARGCVVFWRGHVGIMVDSLNCIHSNAYHMEVRTEPLNEVIRRIGGENKIIKIMDFN